MNLIIFGPPLAGKGTQNEKIINDFGLIHLSTGHALREEMELNTSLGIKAAQFIKKGLLVPDDLVAKIVEKFYHQHGLGALKNESGLDFLLLFDQAKRRRKSIVSIALLFKKLQFLIQSKTTN